MANFLFRLCIILLPIVCKMQRLENSITYHDIISTYRLPKSCSPLSYNISLKSYMPTDDIYFDESDNFKFTGSVDIEIVCHQLTYNIVLNLHKLTIENWKLIDKDNRHHGNNEVAKNSNCPKENHTLEQYYFCFKTHLKQNKRYVFTVHFSGMIPYLGRNGFGLYRGKYTYGKVEKWFAATQFEPRMARSAFPCFDEPHFKATFTLSITHPRQLSAMSNTRIASSDTLNKGWVVTTFEPTPVMSTYLVAFVVSDFSSISVTTTSEVKISIWAETDILNGSHYNLQRSKILLENYEKYLDIPYRQTNLAKLDIVHVSSLSPDAMENWGLIIYRDSNLKYELMAAHEFAHQVYFV